MLASTHFCREDGGYSMTILIKLLLTIIYVMLGSASVAQDQGFLLDVDPNDVNRHLGTFVASDLAVGERGYVYYDYLCAVDGKLAIPSVLPLIDVSDVEEPAKQFIAIQRQPANSIKVEVDLESFRTTGPDFLYHGLLHSLLAPTNCDVKNAQYWPHNLAATYFSVISVNGMTQASDLFGIVAQ
jgi:hypothetical protein